MINFFFLSTLLLLFWLVIMSIRLPHYHLRLGDIPPIPGLVCYDPTTASVHGDNHQREYLVDRRLPIRLSVEAILHVG